MITASPSSSPAVEHARANMIAQQIRTWDVLSQDILDVLQVLHREDFVPPVHRALAFVDTEIPLVVDGQETGETMLAPKFEARMLQEIAIERGESVLEIGTGSGYMAALLASRTDRVVSVEIDPRLRAFAEDNLARAGVAARVEPGNGLDRAADGLPSSGDVDVLVISGSLPYLPDALKRRVRVGGRIAAIVGDAPAMTSVIVHRTGDDAWNTIRLFETVVKPLREAPRRSHFEF